MSKKPDAVQPGVTSDIGKLRPGTLELVFEREIKLESLHKGVAAAARWNGCIACGLNGIDLRIRIQDPVFEVFNGVEGLRDINVIR